MPPIEVIDSSGASATDSCANSGVYHAFGIDVGTFTAAANGEGGYLSGSWAADVTYTHQVPTGVSVGPLANSQVGATDTLTLLSPVAGVLSFTSSVGRAFGIGADPVLGAGTNFTFGMSLGSDVCELTDSGSCTVSVAFSPGDAVLFSWGGFSLAALSGSGYEGSGSAFDSGTFALAGVAFRDDAGNPIPGASILAMSGVEYLPMVPVPVPEPETWALMLAGLGGLTFLSRRRRRG